ncbi:hypothetical protein SAMN03159341_114112 [Paenibacillus sp. 1_12]|uniref:hypothetical protein n=1 Tax=Paenibacillus sp. 1_12 TaxID=1566278 RepID=UPI0008E32151|nr:hypothetical protein [Paenibacillus sp. 1_12]SFM03280.1 hypothetical protein SAMN03159341_114112 [Paenibacillus sp. 1_12]
MKKMWRTILITSLLSLIMSGLTSAQTDGSYVPVAKSSDTHPAYIQDMYTYHGKTYLVVDNIEWYEGKEADAVFVQREPEFGQMGAPSGYYIINDSTKLQTFEIQSDAAVLMQIYDRTGHPEDNQIIWNEPITLNKFKTIWSTDTVLHEYPYHLTITNGEIVKIVQQYIP